MPTLPTTAAAVKLAVAEKHILPRPALPRRAGDGSGYDRRLLRRRNLHAMLAGPLDGLLHQAGCLRGIQELADIGEPLGSVFRHCHRLQVLAIAAIENASAGKLERIFKERRAR